MPRWEQEEGQVAHIYSHFTDEATEPLPKLITWPGPSMVPKSINLTTMQFWGRKEKEKKKKAGISSLTAQEEWVALGTHLYFYIIFSILGPVQSSWSAILLLGLQQGPGEFSPRPFLRSLYKETTPQNVQPELPFWCRLEGQPCSWLSEHLFCTRHHSHGLPSRSLHRNSDKKLLSLSPFHKRED